MGGDIGRDSLPPEPAPWAWLASSAWTGDAAVGSAWGIPRDRIGTSEVLQLRGDGSAADRDDALAYCELLDRHRAEGCGMVGYFGFEVGLALERVRAPQRARRGLGSCPDAVWSTFGPGDVVAVTLPAVAAPHQAAPASGVRGQATFERAVLRAHREIRAGRIYQVNLSRVLGLHGPWRRAAADAPATLAALVAAQPVGYAAVFDVPLGTDRRGVVAAGSMECFLALRSDHADRASALGPGADVGRRSGADGAGGDRASAAVGRRTEARSRPIKGTAPRGADASADAASAAQLLASTKERAENTMIVDMVRHDLGRIAAPGGVEVTALCEAVQYRTLWHLESEVRAWWPAPWRMADVAEATLPPASVTGAPKIAAMRHIVASERRRRGPYCGSYGVIWPDGRADLAVGIRLVLFDGQRAEIPVGAGIVADSAPTREWHELLWKAQSGLRLCAALAERARQADAPAPASAPSTTAGDSEGHARDRMESGSSG